MAVDSWDLTTGRPIFSDTKAPDIAVDPTEVGKYAADVGNQIVRANLAALDAYAYKRSGLMGHALDTGITYRHNGTGWIVRGGDTPFAVMRRTAAVLAAPSGSYGNMSANAAWTATGGTLRNATYSDGIVVTQAGWYEAFWAMWMTGTTPSGIIGVAVNAATVPGGDQLHALGPVVSSIISTGAASGKVRLAAGDKLTLWGYGNSGVMTVRAASSGTEPPHWGVRWIEP